MMDPPQPISWMCSGAQRTGMLHLPRGVTKAAILMVPGGTDYRTGSHRSYVRIAMALADAGYAVLRMDVAGMGDSSGEHPGFTALGPDIAAAVEALRAQQPDAKRLLLWGQCDGASAIILGLDRHFSADAAILCNPWVRSEKTVAQQVIHHHYRRRLVSWESWKRVLRGHVDIARSLKNIILAARALAQPADIRAEYQTMMLENLRAGSTPCLIVIGELDNAGQEFRLFWEQNGQQAPHVSMTVIADGNHSFSGNVQRQAVLKAALDWI